MDILPGIVSSTYMSLRIIVATLLCALAQIGCSNADEVVVYDYRVVNVYPHDTGAFTQGLFFRDGGLYESTGHLGRSSIRRVSLETGKVLRKYDLADKYFGEGIVDWNDRLISVTWKSETGFVLGLDDFKEQDTFSYSGEGWGLTRDDSNIIMSDGTDRLRFLDPETLDEVKSVPVTLRGRAVRSLNELEWIEGELFSNVWQTDWVLRIDPDTGVVAGLVDLSGLLPDAVRRSGSVDVLNGIAYDVETKRIFVTGKFWPSLFEIELIERRPEP